MASKKAMQKKSGTGNFIGGLAIGLAIAIGVGVLGFYTKGYQDWTFGKAEEPPTAEADHNEQLLITPGENNGISMLAEREVTEEGKNVQRITAKVVPDGAELTGGLVWSLEFIEGESSGSWGTETRGAVGEYLKIRETEQANIKEIECMQAFGTQAIIEVRPNDEAYAGMYARCTVDYVQKALGAEINFYNRISEESGLPQEYGYDYTLRPDYLNVKLPFPYATSEDFESRFYSSYVMSGHQSMYAAHAGKDIRGTASQTVSAKFSNVYTVANGVKIEGAGITTLKVWVAKTAAYDRLIELVRDYVGCYSETSKNDVGNFVLSSPNDISIMNLLVEMCGYYVNGKFEDYLGFLSGMKQIAEATMQVKITYTTSFDNEEIETIYNIGWDTSELPVMEGIELLPEDPSQSGGIEF